MRRWVIEGLVSWLIATMVCLPWLPAAALEATPSNAVAAGLSDVWPAPSKAVGRPLAELLDIDGRVQLRGDWQGTVDPSGWRLSNDETGAARFVPSEPWVSTSGRPGLVGPNTFDPLGSVPNVGTNGDVRALAVLGSDLYLGGQFTTAGGVLVNQVAKYTPGTTTFSALGGTPNVGTNGLVLVLAASGGDLYVGGSFTTAGGVTVNNVAKYTPGTNTFSPLGADTVGTTNTVFALAALGNDLYVGGGFTTAGGLTVNFVAKYTPETNTFSALGSGTVGTDFFVFALAALGGDLYVGGLFDTAGGLTANNLARYMPLTNSFSVLGSGAVGPRFPVFALAVLGSDLYLGGQFTTVDGVTANNVARYTPLTNSFSTLGSGILGTSSDLRALAALGSDLYVGGRFITAGGVPVAFVAKYAPAANSFSALGSGAVGTNGSVYALTALSSDLYLGGVFTTAGGVTVNNVAKYTPPPPQMSTPTATPIITPTATAASTSTTTPTRIATLTATSTSTPTPTPTATPPANPLGNLKFLSNPVRVLDTRRTDGGAVTTGFQPNGNPIVAGQLPNNSTTRFLLAGQTFSGATLPANLTGVLINVTIVQATGGGGFVTVFPGDAPSAPLAATVLPPPLGTTPPGVAFRGNFAILGVPPIGGPGPNQGTIAVTSVGDSRDVVIDLVGYYSPSNPAVVGNLRFINPVRVLDTRPAPLLTGQTAACAPITAGPITPSVVNKYGLANCQFGTLLENNQITFPNDLSGILAHITTVQNVGTGGFTTLLPGDAGIPSTATLNPVFPISFNSWANGIPTSGGAGAGQGQFGVYSTNSQEVIVDIVGFFAASNLNTVGNLNFITPARVLDTRPAPNLVGFTPAGVAITAGQLATNTTTRYRLNSMTFAGGALVLPADVKGALVNVTLVQTNAGGGFLTVFPGDAPAAPTTATVNPNTNIAGSFWATGIPNAPASNPGTFGVFSVGDPRDVIVDLSGYFR